jgi:hypothetical protein
MGEDFNQFLPWAPVIGAGLTLAYYGLHKFQNWKQQPAPNHHPHPFTSRIRHKRVNFGS